MSLRTTRPVHRRVASADAHGADLDVQFLIATRFNDGHDLSEIHFEGCAGAAPSTGSSSSAAMVL